MQNRLTVNIKEIDTAKCYLCRRITKRSHKEVLIKGLGYAIVSKLPDSHTPGNWTVKEELEGGPE